MLLREAAKKNSSTNGQAIKSGGVRGVKAGPLRKKELFLKLEAFMAWPLVEELFFPPKGSCKKKLFS
jgi:hypothetical protein